ncbi:MAG: hypothetical protein COA96_12710 [SAR86 cluster bacterium]|uniref:Cytochrome c domain-containing protein n=1 Tax=SAR86 cluster bacterium TaxID=2030880 RepID=A0A2A5AW22_9GAMM|nr:MAG: hypothetical protein COA96_12710 [SAR86 cluster bacterium]
MAKVISLSIVLASLVLSFSAYAQTNDTSLANISQSDLEAGQGRYRVLCARCHGMLGEGGEGPSLKRARLIHAPNDEALFSVISNGIPGTGMPANWALGPSDLVQIAGYVKSLGQLEAEEIPGDAIRGRLVYETKGNCSACHIVSGIGRGVGPELTEVGMRRNIAYLRESVTNPSADQPRVSDRRKGTLNSFLTVRAVSEYGVYEGMRINEDEFSVQMRDIAGDIYSFEKSKLISYEKNFGHSLMPGYGVTLSEVEIDDLVSYLMNLKGEN